MGEAELGTDNGKICDNQQQKSSTETEPRNRFHQPMYPGEPVRQAGLSYRPARLGIDSWAGLLKRFTNSGSGTNNNHRQRQLTINSQHETIDTRQSTVSIRQSTPDNQQ
jgi:hypothetical protein